MSRNLKLCFFLSFSLIIILAHSHGHSHGSHASLHDDHHHHHEDSHQGPGGHSFESHDHPHEDSHKGPGGHSFEESHDHHHEDSHKDPVDHSFGESNNTHKRKSDHSHKGHHHHSHSQEKEHHSHGSFFKTKVFSDQLIKTFIEKYDQLFPNLYIKAIIGIILLSFPSIPVFLLLCFISMTFQKTKTISKKFLSMMVAFSAGTLLGDLLLHMLPHLLMEKDDNNHVLYEYFGQESLFLYIINGVVLFLIIDFIFSCFLSDNSHSHSHEKVEDDQIVEEEHVVKGGNNEKTTKQRNKQKGDKKINKKNEEIEKKSSKSEATKTIIYLIGDMTHNFIDGITVGASFVISTELGLITSIAIFVHEIPHEIGDFAYLYKHNYSLTDILKSQLLTSLGALIGGIMGINWGTIYTIELLGFTCGAFLYLCMVDIFPELKKDLTNSKSFLNLLLHVILIYCGVFLMYLMILLE